MTYSLPCRDEIDGWYKTEGSLAAPLLVSKLKRACDEVSREQERAWSRSLRGVADHIFDLLCADDSVDVRCVDELHTIAALLDGCEIVRRDGLGRDTDVHEVTVTARDGSDASTLDDFMDHVLEDTPKRGYVYVAWSARPESYWYVGRANKEDRIRRHRSHGNLSLALRDASVFTVIFPAREARVGELEAALLRLFRHVGGDLAWPTHNGIGLPVAPHGMRQEQLLRMSSALGKIAARLT